MTTTMTTTITITTTITTTTIIDRFCRRAAVRARFSFAPSTMTADRLTVAFPARPGSFRRPNEKQAPAFFGLRDPPFAIPWRSRLASHSNRLAALHATKRSSAIPRRTSGSRCFATQRCA